MSEEPLPSDAPKEQPGEKPAATSDKQKTKPSEQKMDTASDHSPDAKVDSKPAAQSDERPAIKRNVRGSKSAAKKVVKESSATEGNTDKGREVKVDSDKGAQNNANTSKQGRRGRGRQGKSQADEPKVNLDDKKVAKRAWKIFLGEVGEEGLALIADKDARELARRSLRVAEIYSREEAALYKKSR